MEPHTHPIGPDAMPEPRIVQRGAFLVAGLRYEGRNEHGEVPALWDNEFMPRLGEIAGLRLGLEAYGVAREAPNAAPGAFE